MKNNEIKDFVAYEYLALDVKAELEPLYIDCYESLGWIFINNTALVDKGDYYINHYDYNEKRLVNIRFKRDRRINNKKQLVVLQKKLDNALKQVEKLESIPNSMGVIWAMVIGVLGIIFLWFSFMVIRGDNPIYILGIVCGIMGTVGIILPYFVYNKVKNKHLQENTILIEEQYNTIYDCCEQARKLVY